MHNPDLDKFAAFDDEIAYAKDIDKPDAQYGEEVDSIHKRKIGFQQEQIKDLQSYRKLRVEYASQVMCYLKYYSIVVGGLVFLDAASPQFEIPELAIVTLVGSIAIAAIGLVGFVIKGLFPGDKNN